MAQVCIEKKGPCSCFFSILLFWSSSETFMVGKVTQNVLYSLNWKWINKVAEISVICKCWLSFFSYCCDKYFHWSSLGGRAHLHWSLLFQGSQVVGAWYRCSHGSHRQEAEMEGCHRSSAPSLHSRSPGSQTGNGTTHSGQLFPHQFTPTGILIGWSPRWYHILSSW